ncbi:LysR family transcriptional regulator [Aminobacter aganoensis]|uniref:DNA-binding transcriptional LysR family regulator n=1 Tax=Aminobacter aganoensis TaxID=83264 RepID=A0A7X0FCL6_9HYPH|nr:LysR family transcriptional regulator [Aminobacter aganoensis]MBB6357261.1 DNA-binding transcriptional LysR family regulator [Aminobacter aganoensis]
MTVFAKAVECSSLTLAGRELRMTPGAVTKRLNKLEERLGVRLLNRTTRKIELTEAGTEYYAKARVILSDISLLESSLSTLSDEPRGYLKITAPTLFGRIQICPIILEFHERYPNVHVHLQLTDRSIDLLPAGFDMAISNLAMRETSFVARKLAIDRRVVCGSPGYFERHGRPQVPADLLNHSCLLLRFPGTKEYRWHFQEGDLHTSLDMKGKGALDSDSAEALHQWTLAGAGLSMRSTAEIADDLRSGRLEAVLTHNIRTDRHFSVFYARREMLPQKVRVFVDFMCAKLGRHPHWDVGLGF